MANSPFIQTNIPTPVTVPLGGTGATTLTGLLLGNGTSAVTAITTSAGIAGAISDETGSGALVFATSPTLVTPALGTPSSGVVTNLTGTASININGTVGATTPTTGAFTTLVASSATSLLLGTAGSAVGSAGFRNATSGTITVAPPTGALGTVTNTLQAATDTFVYRATTDTLTNKRITRRVSSTSAPGATPSTNTDNVDIQVFTGLNAAITSMSTNLSGTPNNGDLVEFQFVDNGTIRAITWGASFVDGGLVTLPTTTVANTMLRVLVEYQTTASTAPVTSTNKWVCIATA